MIKHVSLNALQYAINSTLALDENISQKIAPLENKVIQIKIAPLDVCFYMSFVAAQVQLEASTDKTVDTTIESSPLGLIRLGLLPMSKVRTLFNDQVKMRGNTEVGQHVKTLFDTLDIDWEGHLAAITGDVVAYQVGSMFRKGKQFKAHFGSSMRENITDYLQEEVRAFPPKEEVNDFFNDVYTLSNQVERLDAHLRQLKKKHEEN